MRFLSEVYKKAVLIDTGAWVAMYDNKDKHHMDFDLILG